MFALALLAACGSGSGSGSTDAAKATPEGDRIAAFAMADAEVLAALDAVPSLDEDRIGRMFLSLIRATVRTSAFLGRPTLAFKFDPSLVPDLPSPRPQHEIFVCSSRVEGVHLRAGAITAPAETAMMPSSTL